MTDHTKIEPPYFADDELILIEDLEEASVVDIQQLFGGEVRIVEIRKDEFATTRWELEKFMKVYLERFYLYINSGCY